MTAWLARIGLAEVIGHCSLETEGPLFLQEADSVSLTASVDMLDHAEDDEDDPFPVVPYQSYG